MAAYIALVPVQLYTSETFRFAPSDVVLIALILAPGPFITLRKNAWSMWHWFLLATFLLGIVNTWCSQGAVPTHVLLNKGVGILILFATYGVLSSLVDTWELLEWIIRFFVGAAIVHASFAILVFVTVGSFRVDSLVVNLGGSRLSGLLVDPNAFGGFLVTAFALSVGWLWPRSLTRSFVAFLGSLILCTGILLTYSRSAWIGLAASLLALGILKPGRFVCSLLLVLSSLAAIVVYTAPEYLPTVISMATRPEQVEARVMTVGPAMTLFRENVLFGAGLGSFARSEGLIVHNTALWFLTEMGLLGLVAFLGFILWFAYRAARSYRRSCAMEKRLMLALLVAHLAAAGLSVGIEAFYQRYWWVIMSLIGAVHCGSSSFTTLCRQTLLSQMPRPSVSSRQAFGR
jgi:putative inorganic carbon (HCO3(-)) transporter